MKNPMIGLAAMAFMFSILLVPGVLAQTILFEDDFQREGGFPLWNITEGTYSIFSFNISQTARSATDGTTSEMFTNETFYADEFTLTFKANANVGSLSDLVWLEINDSYNLNVQMNLGSGFGGQRVQLREKTGGFTNTFFTDQNYSYLDDGEWYSVKLYVNSGSWSFSIWNESDSEPVDWMYEGSLDPELDLTDGYRIRVYTTNLAAGEYGLYDDILLTTPTPPTPPITTQYPLLAIIPLIIAIAMVVGFVGAFLSGLIDLKTAMTYIVVFTLALAFIGIIFVI